MRLRWFILWVSRGRLAMQNSTETRSTAAGWIILAVSGTTGVKCTKHKERIVTFPNTFDFFFSSHSVIGELSMWTCHSGVSQASYIYFPIVVEMTEHNLRLGWVLTCRFSHYQYIMAFTSNSIHLLHVGSLLKCNLFCCYHHYYYCYWKGAKLLKTMDSWENHCFHCLECRQGKTYYSLVFLLLLRWFSNHSKSIKKTHFGSRNGNIVAGKSAARSSYPWNKEVRRAAHV